MKKYFTKKELIGTIIDTLECYSGYYGDLHNEVFNTSYYISDTSKAKQALGQYGTWEAIEKVRDYEEASFGEVHTDLSDPIRVANMLWYVLGEDIIYDHDIIDNYYMGRVADDEMNREMIERLQEELEELEELEA